MHGFWLFSEMMLPAMLYPSVGILVLAVVEHATKIEAEDRFGWPDRDGFVMANSLRASAQPLLGTIILVAMPGLGLAVAVPFFVGPALRGGR